MASISDIDIEYKYKIKIVEQGDCFAIGIDDAKCMNLNDDWVGNYWTRNYAYYGKEGTLFSQETGRLQGVDYGEKYGTGDVITVCYNPCKSTLAFYKNDRNQGVIHNVDQHEDLSYRLCFLMAYDESSCMQLLRS